MPATPSPADSDSTVTTSPPMSAAGIPVSPFKVEIETKLAHDTGEEAERLLSDLLGRLDRNQATPAEQAMVERRVQVIQVSAAELRAACKKNPKHDLANHFLEATKSYPDGQTICIEQPDLQALLQDRKMVIRHQLMGDTLVLTKEVV